jgi:hypothetical protein
MFGLTSPRTSVTSPATVVTVAGSKLRGPRPPPGRMGAAGGFHGEPRRRRDRQERPGERGCLRVHAESFRLEKPGRALSRRRVRARSTRGHRVPGARGALSQRDRGNPRVRRSTRGSGLVRGTERLPHTSHRVRAPDLPASPLSWAVPS